MVGNSAISAGHGSLSSLNLLFLVYLLNQNFNAGRFAPLMKLRNLTKTFKYFHFHDFCWNFTNALHLLKNFGSLDIDIESFIGKNLTILIDKN